MEQKQLQTTLPMRNKNINSAKWTGYISTFLHGTEVRGQRGNKPQKKIQ
jgi:hypothetical protein